MSYFNMFLTVTSFCFAGFLPGDLAKRMNVSSIVLSTALSAPGIIERATAIASFVSSSLAPGCVFSRFVRWSSCQTRYLGMKHMDERVVDNTIDFLYNETDCLDKA